MVTIISGMLYDERWKGLVRVRDKMNDESY
jgi:hypothetical protein